MSAILNRRDQAISVTDLGKSLKASIDKLVSGEQDRFVVMRNNAPDAVMLSVKEYELIMDEVEDLRTEMIAIHRINNPAGKPVSHEEMFPEHE